MLKLSLSDINECVVHKDKQLCAWKQGCVNTHGGYKCKCPPGYKVSIRDFRLCDPGKRHFLLKTDHSSKWDHVKGRKCVELPFSLVTIKPVSFLWEELWVVFSSADKGKSRCVARKLKLLLCNIQRNTILIALFQTIACFIPFSHSV